MNATTFFCLFALWINFCECSYDNTTYIRLKKTLAQYCSDKNFLQCPDKISENIVSHCCTGCSCHPTCGLTGNCCYNEDDRYHLMESGSLKCMFVDTKSAHDLGDYPMYKFMVGPPNTGCLLAGSCNKSEKLIPWKTFYPVFSREKRMNYLNEECAKCHGVTDGLRWISRFSMTYAESMNVPEIFNFLQNSNSINLYVFFEHPGDDFERIATTCSDVSRESCMIESSSFKLPSNVILTGLTLDEIKYGCLFGPNLPFPHYPVVYKNVFCAICGSIRIRKEKCTTKADRIHSVAFAAIIDRGFVEKLTNNVNSMKTKKACKIGTNDKCREIICPAMQVRDEHDNCVFPTENWHLQFAFMYINLTVQDMAHDIWKISNITESDLLKTFHTQSPWNKCWTIRYIGLRSYEFEDQSLTEFILHLMCPSRAVNPKRFIAGIKKSLSKNWVIHFNNKTFSGHQEFSRYQLRHVQTTRGKYFEPLWEKNKDHTLNRICPFVTNLTTPSWKELYSNPVHVRFFLVITKLFYCKQIELAESDYSLNENCYIMRLTDPSKILFQFETQKSRLEPPKVSICIEDAKMKIVSNNAFGLLCRFRNKLRYGKVVLIILAGVYGFIR